MSETNKTGSPSGSGGDFATAINEAKARLLFSAPEDRAMIAGVRFTDGRFAFEYLGMLAEVDYPGGECRLGGKPCHPWEAFVLLRCVTDGRIGPPTGRWIAYREIPDSAPYVGAFQGRGPDLIAQHLGEDPEGFIRACEKIGATRTDDLPGLAYTVDALPGFPMALILHPGEPGLPAGGQILFDAAAGTIWCAEDLAGLGEMTAAWLVRLAKQ